MTAVKSQFARLLGVTFAVLLLAGCLATVPQKPQFVQRAQAAITANNFDGAYRILEDAFLYEDPEIRNAAIQLFKSEPRLRIAAIETFSRKNLYTTHGVYGANTYTPLVKRRLQLFEQVATKDEAATARNNFEYVLANPNELAEEENRARQAAEADRRAASAKRATEEEKKKEVAVRAHQTAKNNAVFRCQDRSACDKAFALTQVFINSKSDMKIQIANDTVIQTYNPTELFGVGLSAVKMPRAGSSADIIISVNCKSTESNALLCLSKSTLIYQDFPDFMRNNFIP